MQEGKFTAFF